MKTCIHVSHNIRDLAFGGLASLMCLCATLATAATSHVTEPLGSVTGVIPAGGLTGTDVMLSAPMFRASAYQGAVAAIEANNIMLSGLPNFTATQLVYASGTQPKTYGLLVTTGVAEGVVLPIYENTINTVRVSVPVGETLDDIVAGGAAPDKVVIVPLWTPATLFPSGVATGSKMYFLRDPGAGVNLSATVELTFNGAHWVDGVSAISDDFAIGYAEGFVFRNPVNALAVSYRFIGSIPSGSAAPMVKHRQQICTLADNTDQDVWLGYRSPLPESIALSSLGFDTGDQLMFLDNAASGINKMPPYTYEYDETTFWTLRDINLTGGVATGPIKVHLTNGATTGVVTVNLTGGSTTGPVTVNLTGGSTTGPVTVNLAGGATTNMLSDVTVTDTTGVLPGMSIVGAGIPGSTTVSVVVDGTTLTLSNAATATAAGLAFVASSPASNTVTVADTTGVVPGMGITGAGIPVNTTVSVVVNGTTLTLSNAATTTGAGLALTASSPASSTVTVTSTAGVVPGMSITGSGIPVNTTVALVVNGTTLTLSNAATATGTGLAFTASSPASADVTVTDTTGVAPGMGITGASIPSGTTILVVVNGTTLTLSNLATASATGQTFEVTTVLGSNSITAASVPAEVAIGMVIESDGFLAPGTTIIGKSGNTLTLSVAAIATGSNLPLTVTANLNANIAPNLLYLNPSQGYIFAKKGTTPFGCTLWSDLPSFLP
ncbi:MAG: TIGR02597 family protein [Fimbriimonadaceae bacterium]